MEDGNAVHGARMAILNPPSSLFDVPQFAPTTRRWLYALVIAVAGAQGLANILTATLLFSPARWPETRPPDSPMFSANDRSRWCTVWSLAERGTYQIDEIIRVPGWDTIDKVRFNDHFYSSKPPLLSTLVAGLYQGVKRTFGLDLLKQTQQTVHVLLLLVNWMPWLVSLALLAVLTERYGQSDFGRLFMIVTAAWGTFLTTFLITLNNHTVAACSLIFSLVPALAIAIDGRREGWRFAMAGFWAAFTVCNELPACAFGAAMFVWLARHDLKKACLWFVPAALVPLAAFVYTNWLATGSLTPFYASFGAATNNYYHYVFEGVPSYWMHPSAVDRGESSAWVYLWNCTLGHHGIWSLSPVFLLTIAGWVGLVRRSAHPLRAVSWLSLGLTIWILAFYLRQTSSFNYGGVTSGLRWTFWLIPLWLLGLVPVLDACGACRGMRVFSILLLGVSVYSATYPQRNPWQQPWLNELWETWRTPTVALPDDTEPTPRALWFELPDTPPTAPDQYWVELIGAGSDGGPATLRISMVKSSDAEALAMEVLRTEGARTSADAMMFELDPIAWKSGAALSEVLRQPRHDEPTARRAALRFLQGLPRPITWAAGAVRYLKTPVRTDAFECRVAVAAVLVSHDDGRPPLRYRRAVWWSREIPFGVVQIDDTVTDPRDNSIVFKQRLTAARVGNLLSSE